eukprot:TRINITY_DN1645_c0_g1_i2.p1 TRINITY_DN1645_c0_g1~~TRINITY_DN1645_c0_g1_i2.p1  ORF type:complete len:144 (-),score=32.30 TRINITY_DN1645_c0_g1_i2:31-462(-)
MDFQVNMQKGIVLEDRLTQMRSEVDAAVGKLIKEVREEKKCQEVVIDELRKSNEDRLALIKQLVEDLEPLLSNVKKLVHHKEGRHSKQTIQIEQECFNSMAQLVSGPLQTAKNLLADPNQIEKRIIEILYSKSSMESDEVEDV